MASSANVKLLFILSLSYILHCSDTHDPHSFKLDIDDITDYQCIILSGYQLYDLRPLYSMHGDYQISNPTSLYNYFFNFCIKPQNQCNSSDKNKAWAYQKTKFYIDKVNQCNALSDEEQNPAFIKTMKTQPSADGLYYNTKLFFTMKGGSQCNNRESSISYEITCDASQTGTPSFTINEQDSCNPIISLSHHTGCPVASMSQILFFFSQHPYIFALLMLFFGPVLLLSGRKFVPLLIGVISALFMFFFLLYILEELSIFEFFLDEDEDPESLFIAYLGLIGAFLISVFVGYLMKSQFLDFGFAVLGAAAGLFFGQIFFNVFIMDFAPSIHAYLIALMLFTVSGAIIGYNLKDSAVITCTSLIGAYLIVRGLSIFIGGYPSEIVLINQLRLGEVQFTMSLMGYLASVILITIIGIYHQVKEKEKEQHHSSHIQDSTDSYNKAHY